MSKILQPTNMSKAVVHIIKNLHSEIESYFDYLMEHGSLSQQSMKRQEVKPSCWIEHEQHFSNSKVDDVTVTCNERKNEEIVEGYNILNWAIDYVCSICDECVFEIVWESECLAECTCVWCLWGDPCPYGDAPMDRSYYLIDTSDAESGYESFTDEESI
ncbi:hypothetical protein V9T40_006558 [Parthenolecanium corni]|uniref:Uncharacterized protein n=1 Tax=Parthenolecanium corni TaxID=536013 RepID=A0AAN9Y5B2_9HEMI